MGRNPFNIGTTPGGEANINRTLFYFMREFKQNPLDEEYIVTPVYECMKWWIFRWKRLKSYRIVKKGLSLPYFSMLIDEMNEHYKREESEMKKSRRK